MDTLKCRACSAVVCSRYDAIKLVSKAYELSESSEIRVWHPGCAVDDGRIDYIEELDGDPFYYEIRS